MLHSPVSLTKSILTKYAEEITSEESYFWFALLARLLLSSVIEGDRRDTAEFMNETHFPAIENDMRLTWATTLQNMERRLAELPNISPIDRARSQFSDICRSFAEHKSGIYRLNIPTGGGKTLSALRYALAHAGKYNKRRIIFTSPLLSILEQNAKVIRQYVGNDDLILEHHSNIIKTTTDGETLSQNELLAENWNAPIIITTLVQLLNTMFSGKTTAVRRFWALCDSIIVIDEVQTVPGRFLSLFNCAVNFLSKVCCATIVLCSATQPCLEKAGHPLLNEPEDIVKYDPELWAPFRRTELISESPRPLNELPELARNILSEADSLLIVCNKKYEAEYLFRELQDNNTKAFHLSASMCTAHRRETTERLREALALCGSDGQKVLCVSTQVIEAGVDISFARVIRLTAGMDSIIQSAGRCNRNGEAPGTAPVRIISCSDENLSHLEDIQRGKDASIQLMNDYSKAPERFDSDLAGDKAISFYYKCLWRDLPAGYQDGPLRDGRNIFDLLTENTAYCTEEVSGNDRYFLRQAFKTAGDAFHVFEDDTDIAVVPYKDGNDLITEALQWGHDPDLQTLRNWLERAKPYTVTIYHYQKKLLEEGGMYAINDVAYILQPEQYSEQTGIVLKPEDMSFLEV